MKDFRKIKMESEKFIDDGEIVSIRCLRHKRRFNVEKEWIDTCQWLCPQCHSALSEEERERYRPRSGILPEVREAETGKPTMYPKFVLKAGLPPIISEEDELKIKTEFCEQKISKPKPKPVREKAELVPNSKASDNPSFKGLLPRYRIHCLKCGKTVPCHYSWFDNSTVLCPECYAGMGELMRDYFHSIHKAEKPEYKENRESLYDGPPTKVFEEPSKKVGRPKKGCFENDNTSSLSGWSNDRIMSATLKELEEGVELGSLSRVRMKIELGRRRNSHYYNMLAMPDMEKARPTI